MIKKKCVDCNDSSGNEMMTTKQKNFLDEPLVPAVSAQGGSTSFVLQTH